MPLTGFLRLSRSPNPAVKVGKKVREREGGTVSDRVFLTFGDGYAFFLSLSLQNDVLISKWTVITLDDPSSTIKQPLYMR